MERRQRDEVKRNVSDSVGKSSSRFLVPIDISTLQSMSEQLHEKIDVFPSYITHASE